MQNADEHYHLPPYTIMLGLLQLPMQNSENQPFAELQSFHLINAKNGITFDQSS
jgi:hypothetical protein